MWTHDSELATDLDKVRFALADTDENDPLVSNEEITSGLTQYGNVFSAASNLARSIALKLGRRPSVTFQQAGLSSKEQHDHYIQLSQELAARAAVEGGAGIFGGGISIADKGTREADTDRVPPAFTVNLHRNP